MKNFYPSGVSGLDQIMGGGLPRFRSTLVSGGPGAGKTLFGVQAMANFVNVEGKHALYVSFEENPLDLIEHTKHFNWNIEELVNQNKIQFLDARLSPQATFMGHIEMEGMLSIIHSQLNRVNAELLIIDGLDLMLSMQPDHSRILQQLFALDRFLRDQNLTSVITVKSHDNYQNIASSQAAQYIVDCVIELERRLEADVAVSTLRIIKSRGASIVSNRIPMAINGGGIELLVQDGKHELNHKVFYDRISSGIERLDKLLGGGFYKGSTILISGSPGTAKTTLAGHFLSQACNEGKKALFVSFDEAPEQITRNLSSVSINLQSAQQGSLLHMVGMRAASTSAHHHVLKIKHAVEAHNPEVLVIDPVTALVKAGGQQVANSLAELLVDFVKSRGITTIFTSLVDSSDALAEMTSTHISTMADTWLHLTFSASGGERNRALTIVKSRGSAHSNQVRELILSQDGLDLRDVFISGSNVLMGSARIAYEAKLAADERQMHFDRELQARKASAKLTAMKAQLAAMAAEIEASELESGLVLKYDTEKDLETSKIQQSILNARFADKANQ